MTKNNYSIKSTQLFSEVGREHIPVIRFPGLSKYEEILHFITTRHGGYSEKPFHSLNLASHIGDREENVLKNRECLARSLGIRAEKFFFTRQEHGNRIFLINEEKLFYNNNRLTGTIPVSDAMITDCRDICLLIFIADCVPVLLFDCRKKIIGLVHAGWKGTVSLISQKTVQLMQSHYGSRVQDIICAIGPSIGPCCYEVGNEVLGKVKESFPEEKSLISFDSKKGKYFFDLWQANKTQLLNCGIPDSNIETASLCTSCHSDLFFSSRKEHQCTGRFAAGIMLKK
ncbi:MAG: peptidoglycan editing factor PgeF [Atribacterota bacterium]